MFGVSWLLNSDLIPIHLIFCGSNFSPLTLQLIRFLRQKLEHFVTLLRKSSCEPALRGLTLPGGLRGLTLPGGASGLNFFNSVFVLSPSSRVSGGNFAATFFKISGLYFFQILICIIAASNCSFTKALFLGEQIFSIILEISGLVSISLVNSFLRISLAMCSNSRLACFASSIIQSRHCWLVAGENNAHCK